MYCLFLNEIMSIFANEMKKNIIIACGLLVLMGAPITTKAVAAPLVAEISAINNDIDISVNGSTIVVSNAQGMNLQVVSLTGRVIANVRIDSPSQRVELNVPNGCYIVKVGNVARKISIKN